MLWTSAQYPAVPASNGTAGNGWTFNPGGSAWTNHYDTNSAKANLWMNRNGSASGKFIQFRYGANNIGTTGERGNIRLTDSGNKTQYNTTSDYRENVAPLTSALDQIKQLKPCTWDWKGSDATGVGFIAHELQEVPQCCLWNQNEVVDIGTLTDASGNILAQNIENDDESIAFYTNTTDEEGNPVLLSPQL